MHIYHGTLSLPEIAQLSGTEADALAILRSNAAFMRLVDTSKQECAQWIKEDLILNDRTVEEYDSIASDYSMLEEVLRMQIKVPLFAQLREAALGIKSKSMHGLKIDPYNLRLFRKFYLFFLFAEKYLPTLTSKSLPDLKQIAEETVWPSLAFDKGALDRVLGEPPSLAEKVKDLKSELNSLTEK